MFWTAFAAVRKVVVFALGVVILLDAITDKFDTVAKLIIGAILIGVLPLDDVLPWSNKRRGITNASNGS